MVPLILLAALQAATAAPPVPARFSILAPVADQPCVRRADPDEIVVCGDALPDQSLPYPGEVIPDRPVASNPQLTGRGAMAATGTPCAAMQAGCTGGFGGPLVDAALRGASDLAADLFRRKPDKRGRVSIPLDDTPLPAPASPPPKP